MNKSSISSARTAVLKCLNSDFDTLEYHGVLEVLPQSERGLFLELYRGVARRYLFLDWVIGEFSEKYPKRALANILRIAAYQLIFLDRIPEYAVSAESEKMATSCELSKQEKSYLSAIQKKISTSKNKLLEKYRETLEVLTKKEKDPESELEWSVLNATPALLDTLTVIADGVDKKTARKRAIASLIAMQEQQAPSGFWIQNKDKKIPVPSNFEDARKLAIEGRFWFQGKSSQWTCEIVAKKILEILESKKSVKILEMCAGKGGKLLGTIAKLEGIDPTAVNKIEWTSVDSSSFQIEQLEKNVEPIVRDRFKMKNLNIFCTDWERSDFSSKDKFDLVWIDAPCSGLGTLQKNPEISYRLSSEPYAQLKKIAEVQTSLAKASEKLLKSDGVLVYSVCSMTYPETFGVQKYIESKRPIAFSRVLFPPETDEGFFLLVS